MPSQTVNVIRWTENEPPTEATLRERMAREGLHPYRWGNAPHDVYGVHSHPYHKVIYVVRGSITFHLPETGEDITLRAGDRLELPAGVRHAATVGPQGVVCLEAHR